MKEVLRDKTFLKISIFVFCAVFLYGVINIRWNSFFIPQAKLADFYIRLTHVLKPLPASLDDIVIVKIDSKSIHALHTPWPWKRSVIAQLIDRVNEYSPKVILLDFVFSGKDREEGDLLLHNSLRKAGNVLLASYVSEDGRYVPSDPFFAGVSAGCGLANKPRDKDLSVRRSRLALVSLSQKLIDYSLVFKTYCFFKDIPLNKVSYDDHAKIISLPSGDNIFLHDDRTIDVNYSFSPEKFHSVSAEQILNRQVPLQALRNKAVFIGTSAEIVHDICPVPTGVLAGIVINAYEMVTFMEKSFVQRLPFVFQSFILLLGLMIVGFMSYRFSLLKGLIGFVGVIMVSFLLSLILHLNNISGDDFGLIFLGTVFFVGINLYKEASLFVEREKLKELVITDSLTGAYVRRYFEVRLAYEWERARRYANYFSVVIIDIDFFKQVNDTRGHLCGDQVLIEITTLIKMFCRNVDIVCRYGGEEFVVILPHTGKESALIFAERLRRSIAEFPFQYKDTMFYLTVSMGIAEFNEVSTQSSKSLIDLADSRLYQAKAKNRNCIVAE